MDAFQSAFFYLDLLIGFGAPVLALALYRLGLIHRRSWHQFWLGVGVGATWELPIFVGSYAGALFPTVVLERPFPIHWSVFMVSHSLWDGGLFLVGCWILGLIWRDRALQRFHPGQLLVFVVYGQLQELAVELGSTSNAGWVFIDTYWWNPVMFTNNGYPITLFPQVFWLYGSLTFYFLWLKIAPRRRFST